MGKATKAPASASASYVVAPGKTVQSRGITVQAGKPVHAGHFSGGKKDLDALVKSGVVIKK